MDWKLYRGFENGNIALTGRPNELLVLGGRKRGGDSKQVWLYNFRDGTVINKKQLMYTSKLKKHCQVEDSKIIILGPTEQINRAVVEVYDLEKPSKNYSIQIKSNSDFTNMKTLNFNTPSLVIPTDDSLPEKFKNRNYRNKSILFGNYFEPFQIEVDSKTGDIDNFPIPTAVNLKNFQGVARVADSQIFFCGGANNKITKVSDKAFIYDLKERRVETLSSMKYCRYFFSAVYLDGFVYCIGGRGFGMDANAILKYTERFNLETKTWEELGPLNFKRCSTSAFVVKNRVFVAGGYQSKTQILSSIEVFNEPKMRWECLGVNLTEPLEACLSFVKDTQVILFGGSNLKAQTKDAQFIDLELGDLAEAISKKNALKHTSLLKKACIVDETLFIFGSGTNTEVDIFDWNQLGKKKFVQLKNKTM